MNRRYSCVLVGDHKVVDPFRKWAFAVVAQINSSIFNFYIEIIFMEVSVYPAVFAYPAGVLSRYIHTFIKTQTKMYISFGRSMPGSAAT